MGDRYDSRPLRRRTDWAPLIIAVTAGLITVWALAY